jgi:hypothetical protein
LCGNTSMAQLKTQPLAKLVIALQLHLKPQVKLDYP